MIVIDTSVAVDFLRGSKEAVSALASAEKSADAIGISTISVFELLHPLQHRKLDAQEKIVRSFVHGLRVLPLDSDAAEESAKIMGSLLRIGRPINALDVLIAGTAVAVGAEEVLSTDKDYERISEISSLKLRIVGR